MVRESMMMLVRFIVLMFLAEEGIAHPGHGAPPFHTHVHDWDFALLVYGVAILIAAVAFWRAK